jgi:hypothetical protein
MSRVRPDDSPGLPADLSVLHVDHCAAFWHRMDRNYRRRYEAMRRHQAFTCCDVREGPRMSRRRFDVLIVGVFGCPLHPLFPEAAPWPAAAFDLARARCLMVEDLHEGTYAGGLDRLCRHIEGHYDYLISTYDCPALESVRALCPHLKGVFILPHHIDTSVYRDYGLPESWDVLLYGNVDRVWYPFRRRLFGLVPRGIPRTKIVPHPTYQLHDRRRCGVALARLLNRSRLAIATPSSFDYLVAKYFEISGCRCVVAGQMASQGEALWGDRYVRLDPSMSDGEILDRLRRALDRPDALAAMADAMYREVQNRFGLGRYVDDLLRIAAEIASGVGAK